MLSVVTGIPVRPKPNSFSYLFLSISEGLWSIQVIKIYYDMKWESHHIFANFLFIFEALKFHQNHYILAIVP